MISDSGKKATEASERLGLPIDLIQEADGFEVYDGGIYPDNMMVVRVFSDMLTQWRTGPMGATGLDYGVLPTVLQLRRVAIDEREDVFDCLQIMEQAALREMRRGEE